MKLFKTIYIIAQYQENPEYWTDLVMRFSKYLTQKHDLRLIDGMQVVIINCHSSIHLGAYGNDARPEDREVGMRQTKALCAKIASEPQNELFMITRNDLTISSGTTGDLKTWQDNRSDIWKENVEIFTVEEAEKYIKMFNENRK